MTKHNQRSDREMGSKFKIENTQDHVAFHMDKIVKHFVPGSKITVLVRQPSDSEGKQDFIMTNDDLNEAKTMVQRRIEKGHELKTQPA
jgi:hypothetical protein